MKYRYEDSSGWRRDHAWLSEMCNDPGPRGVDEDHVSRRRERDPEEARDQVRDEECGRAWQRDGDGVPFERKRDNTRRQGVNNT